ncbi:KilA-N domain-containing protein [Paraburkholderia sp. BR14263]|uniref:KilA-N domain-containing protein n=1 Tax=unclassified Paraburkholderia TaxID=2615204 RepID=UPI0034D001AE
MTPVAIIFPGAYTARVADTKAHGFGDPESKGAQQPRRHSLTRGFVVCARSAVAPMGGPGRGDLRVCRFPFGRFANPARWLPPVWRRRAVNQAVKRSLIMSNAQGALALDHSRNPLAIDAFEIHELDGLFSLTDLHKASGGEAKHEPNRFLRLDQTQALIAELGKYPEMGNFEKGANLHLFLKVVRGRNGGTYACRELVIAYAAWISPAFHLKVIRVFLAVSTPAPSAEAAWGADYIHISPNPDGTHTVRRRGCFKTHTQACGVMALAIAALAKYDDPVSIAMRHSAEAVYALTYPDDDRMENPIFDRPVETPVADPCSQPPFVTTGPRTQSHLAFFNERRQFDSTPVPDDAVFVRPGHLIDLLHAHGYGVVKLVDVLNFGPVAQADVHAPTARDI